MDVKQSNSIAVYNKYIDSVEKVDMLLSIYRSRFWCKKWYHCIVFYLFSLSTVNSWTMYQELGGNNTLVYFVGKICFSLIKGCA